MFIESECEERFRHRHQLYRQLKPPDRKQEQRDRKHLGSDRGGPGSGRQNLRVIESCLVNLVRFRVDNVHQETYKILGGLHRHGLQGEFQVDLIVGEDKEEGKAGEEGGGAKEDGEEGEDNYQESEKKRKRKKLTFTDKQGEKTLDKIDNINIQEFDTEAVVDPLFK